MPVSVSAENALLQRLFFSSCLNIPVNLCTLIQQFLPRLMQLRESLVLFCFFFLISHLLAGQNQLVVLWLLLFFIQLLFFLSFCAEEPGQLRRSKHAIHSETAWCPSERHWGELCSQAGNECSGVFPACNSTKSLQRPLSSLSGAVLRVIWADREAFYLVLCRNAVCCMWCFYSAYKRVWNLLPVSENWFKQF